MFEKSPKSRKISHFLTPRSKAFGCNFGSKMKIFLESSKCTSKAKWGQKTRFRRFRRLKTAAKPRIGHRQLERLKNPAFWLPSEAEVPLRGADMAVCAHL